MAADCQILTVAQMVAAEQALIDRGASVGSLMEIAGTGAADWVWRVAAGRPVTVLCGPGNNGGDGYVIARELARRGSAVTVIAPLEPKTDAALAARRSYGGAMADRGQGGVLVDCLFGSGLARPLSGELAALLTAEAERHAYRVAIDLPSGVDSDLGKPLNRGLPGYELTLALGAWKFAHWLMPAMAAMGARRLVPIGVEGTPGAARLLTRAKCAAPEAHVHKYTRGLVLVVGGAMPGASLLAAEGAMRAGAGAVRLAAPELPPSAPADLVLRTEPLDELLGDERTGAVLVGPGLGRGDEARDKLSAVLKAGHPAVVDADGLRLLDPDMLAGASGPPVLTPHEGELAQLVSQYGIRGGSKIERALALADAAQAVVVAKGPDTVITAPDGRLTLAPSPTAWLSVAGTGDVLAGIVASRLAAGSAPFDAACEAVWLHGEAARLAGPAFTASELARRVSAAYASTL